MDKSSRISTAIRNIPAPLSFFILVLSAGIILVVAVAPPSAYATLGLLSLAGLFSFLTTMVRFSDACFRQRSALTLSFLGGYAVLLVPLFVISSDYPILPPESCSIASLHFYCFGTPSSVYYSVIDRMCIAGVGSIFAACSMPSTPELICFPRL